MKKILCFAAAAMVLFAGCQKTEIVYSNDGPQEISVFAVNKVATKTPVDGATFQTTDDMQVAAYLAEGASVAGNFFAKTKFEQKKAEEQEKADANWTGNPSRFWPITASTINFLAVTDNGGNVANRTAVSFDGTNYASAATVVLSNNGTYDQTDLMFAAGQGKCAPNNYPAVEMIFKHALAWINFKVSTPSTGATITVNSITLNNATYNGSLAITNSNYASTTDNVTTENLTAEWTPGAPTDALKVPAANGTAAAAVTLTDEPTLFGNGLLVVPDAYAGSFTINYTLTQAGNTALTYNYTYNLPTTGSWEMAKKYFYNIVITLTEIKIDPKVTNWGPQDAVAVPLG